MAARLLARPTAVLLCVGAGAAFAASAALVGLRGEAVDSAYLIAVLGLVAVAAIALLPYVDPAYPLCAGIAASTLSGNWSHLSIPLGLDRPLMLYGIAGVLLRMLPDARPRVRIRLTALHYLLAGIALYAIGSAAFSGTLLQREPLFALLDKLGIVGFLLFAIAPVAFGSEAGRRVLLATLVLLGAYLGLTALFEALGAHQLVFPRYINDPNVGIHAGRARGPFVEAAANGLALYACFVAAVIGAVQWRERRGVRAGCIAVAGLCALGLVLTLTRQVWLGATVASVVALLSTRDLRRYLLPAVVVGVIGVFGAVALVPGLRADITQRAEDRQPVWDRLNSDRAALAMLDAQPLTGFGWYRFGSTGMAYYRQAATYPLTTVNQVHNVFLGYAAELGLIGTLAWLLALIAAVAIPIFAGRAPP